MGDVVNRGLALEVDENCGTAARRSRARGSLRNIEDARLTPPFAGFSTRQLEHEPSLTQIVVELLPLRLRRLTGLVFGPAIGFGIAALGRIALLLTRCG